jgi:hypothetical protein
MGIRHVLGADAGRDALADARALRRWGRRGLDRIGVMARQQGALAVYGVAGELAAEQASRPGSYRVAFMDMLDAINAADVAARLKVL